MIVDDAIVTYRDASASPTALVAAYEDAVAAAVESTIAAGLRQAGARGDVRARVPGTWRDPLTFIATEALSLSLGNAASARQAHVSVPALRRLLRPYARLVAVAAQREGLSN